MPHDFDDTLKKLVHANKEDFVRFVMPDQDVEVVDTLETEFKRTIIADAMIHIKVGEEPAALHFEFQARNEEDVPMRVLEYQYQGRRKHKLPIFSFVFYLQEDGEVPSSPLTWGFPRYPGDVLQFNYKVIDLATMSAEELRSTGLAGVMPLMILTRDGATREVAEEIMTDLGATGKDEALLTAYVLIGLVFDKKTAEDRQWLRRRWHAMSERLKDNWFYKEITEEAREEERKKLEAERKRELEEERKKLEAERRQELDRWRQTMQRLVQERFAGPKMALLAEGQAAIITDPNVLQDLILKLAVARSEEEAKDYLLSWRKAS
jgi:hypothetical protein